IAQSYHLLHLEGNVSRLNHGQKEIFFSHA
ncbi:MAG: hypothetical protein ACI90V_011821, partial [Bacillariaceae sp.]